MVFTADVHVSGFTVLYEPPEATIDIVFVHGFTGHPRDTWTLKNSKRPRQSNGAEEPTSFERPSKFPRLFSRAKSTASSSNASDNASRPNRASTLGCSIDPAASTHGSDVFWPADLLRHTVSTARVLTYGYDTHVKHWFQGQVSKNTVHDHAANLLSGLEARRRTASEISRPLLFIVHSLGGIVVKEALRQSKGWNLKPHLHNIFERTIGCVFFGTPHRGSDPRNAFHHIISYFVQACGWKPNKQIVDTLMPNNERLASLNEDFSAMCQERNWQVHSFQEEYGLAGLFGTKVVDDSSSCLDEPLIETREHIASNHMDMCRFHGLDDPGYRQVAAAITRIISNTQQSAQPDLLSRQPQLAHKSTQSTTQDQHLEGDHVMSDVSSRHSPAMLNGAQSTPHISRGAIDETLRNELVQKLYFDKIDERLTGLSAAYGRTCRWFLDKPEYMSWLDEEHLPEHGGFLWIKGNPGTGKSTLMKFLFERAKESAKDDPSHIYLSFFFNARGDVDEKSTHGLYRSLLHQLFRHAPDLVESLEWMTLDGARGIQRSGWHDEALKQTLKHATKVLGDRSLTIFVDALDECHQTQATDMVEAFEELCELARSLDITLRICFSSRHYPTITIQIGLELILEHETGHDEDIRTYIKSKLRLGKSKQGETLRAEILEKSSGIFLWVVLVIEILNREFPQGSITQFRARLKSIPPKLHELFEMILKRDGDNLDQLRISFNLILFAKRPLKPQELYFAVQLGLDKNAPTHWDTDDINLDQMKTFVSTSSKGLAQVTRNKASEVQFIHESVRDFLLGKHGSQWSEAPENTEGCGHDMLKDCCLAQLQTPAADLPEQLPKASGTELRTQLPQKYPFLEYSIQHVFHHSDGAQRLGIDQSSFMSAFPLTAWVALNNALEQFDNRRYSKSVSMLYVLAEQNTAHLITAHLDLARLCFEPEEERYGAPITAALATGSIDAAHAMYSSIREYSNRHSALDALQYHLSSLCRVYGDSRGGLPLLPRDFGSRRKAVRWQIITSKNEPLFAHFLLHHTLFSSSRRDLLNFALFLAAQSGDLDLETLILSQGGNNLTDSPDTIAPLSPGNFSSTSDEFRLERDFDVDTKEGDGWTPFWWAAKSGHTNIATLLLVNGADINAEVRDKTCLWWAVTHDENPMVQLLLDLGADIERRHNGQTLLTCVASHGDGTTARLLLDRGAEIEARNYLGRTPLSIAAGSVVAKMVLLLLEKGAEIETRDYSGRTPLSWASGSIYSAIPVFEVLLASGADPTSVDLKGKSPLDWAKESGIPEKIRLLEDALRKLGRATS